MTITCFIRYEIDRLRRTRCKRAHAGVVRLAALKYDIFRINQELRRVSALRIGLNAGRTDNRVGPRGQARNGARAHDRAIDLDLPRHAHRSG